MLNHVAELFVSLAEILWGAGCRLPVGHFGAQYKGRCTNESKQIDYFPSTIF